MKFTRIIKQTLIFVWFYHVKSRLVFVLHDDDDYYYYILLLLLLFLNDSK